MPVPQTNKCSGSACYMSLGSIPSASLPPAKLNLLCLNMVVGIRDVQPLLVSPEESCSHRPPANFRFCHSDSAVLTTQAARSHGEMPRLNYQILSSFMRTRLTEWPTKVPYPFGVSMNPGALPSYNHFTPFCRTCTVEALFHPSTQTPCGPPKSKTFIGRAITRKPQACLFTLSFRLKFHEIWHTNEAMAEQVPLTSCTYLLYAVGLVLYKRLGLCNSSIGTSIHGR